MGISHVFTSPVADGTDTRLVRPSDWNSLHLYSLQDAVSLSGNTSGALANISTGTLYLAGGNNVTLSQNGNSVTISGANAGGAQTGISGIQVSDTTYTSGTVTFRNLNGISFGSSGAGGITASYTVPTVTNSSMTVSDAATSGTLARLAFTNLNGVTLSLSTGAGGSHTIVGSHNALTSQSNQNVTAGNGGFAFQTLSFSNLNGISFGTSAGSAITASYTVPTVTNSSWTVSDNATSLTISRLAFTNSNGLTLTLSTAAGAATVVGSYTVPTVPAQLSVGNSNIGNTSGDTGVVTGRLVLAGGNNITLSGSTNAGSMTLTISGPNTVAQTNQSAIKALGASNTGNTAGNTGVSTGIDWVIAGTNNVTVSESTAAGGPNTLWLSAAGAGAGQFSGGASNLGNTAGSTGVTGTRLVFVGTNMVSLSQSTDANGGTLSFNATQTNQSAIKGLGASNTGNTAGNTGISTGIDFVLAGSNGITVSQSTAAGNNTLWVSGDGVTLSTYEPWPMHNTGTAAASFGTATSAIFSFWPMPVDQYVSAGAFQLLMSMSFVTMGTSSGQQTASWVFGVYTRGTGANSTTMSQLTSASVGLSVTYNNSTITVSQPTSTAFTGYGLGSTTSAGLNITSGYTGMKVVHVPVNSLLTPGMYWLGAIARESSSSNSGGIRASLIGNSQALNAVNMAPIGSFLTDYSGGGTNFAGPNCGVWLPFLGTWNPGNTLTSLPNTFAISNLQAPGVAVPYLRFWST